MAIPAGAGGEAAPQPRSRGVLPTKRRQLHWPAERDFRILSLDGGGIKGLYTAALLARLEERCLGGASIGDYFDLIAGTSTGGIIALGLGAGRSASEILRLYLDHGESIFPWPRNFGILRPAFRARELEALLTEALGGLTIADANTRLNIPSCEGRFGDVNVFKTPHHPDFRMDWERDMKTAALATSAAPTFLPVHRYGGYFYVDGGLWANNPAMVAVVDAVTCYDLAPGKIRMLSIGTGAGVPALRGRHLSFGGLVAWAFKGTLLESFMHYSSLNADGQAGLMMGRDHLVRIAPSGEAALVQMTDYGAALQHLVPAGAASADEHREVIAKAFLTVPAQRPTFYYGPKATGLEPDWAH